MEADYLSWGKLVPEWHLLPSIVQAAFQCWSFLIYQSVSASLQSGKKLPSGALGLNMFSHGWKSQVSYVLSPPAFIPLVLSKFLAEHVTSLLRLLILVVPCWMEASWLPTVLKMLKDVPHWCPIIKDFITHILVGLVLKGLPLLHLSLFLLRDWCSTDMHSLLQSVRP